MLPLHHVAVLVGLVGVEPIIGRVSDGCTHTVVLQPSGGPGRTRTAIGRVQAGCSPFELQAHMVYPAGVEPASSAMSARRVRPLRYGYTLAPASGIEPPAGGFGDRCSCRLSYVRWLPAEDSLAKLARSAYIAHLLQRQVSYR